MSVSVTASRISSVGNGVTTVFNYPYYFQSQNDLKVALFVAATGVITPLVLNVDYTIAGAVTAGFGYLTGANLTVPGATLNVPAVLPAGTFIVIYRDPALLQNLELPLNSPYVPEPIESEFDAETLMIQRLSDLLSRSIRLPDGFAAAFDTTLPSTMALVASQNCVIAINPTGNGFIIGPTVTAIANAAAEAAAAAASAATAAADAAIATEASVLANQAAADAAADLELIQGYVANTQVIDTSAGDVNQNLPAVQTGVPMMAVYINKTGSIHNLILIPAAVANNVHGNANLILGSGEVGSLWFDGAVTWWKLN